jgi:hypothetical protein
MEEIGTATAQWSRKRYDLLQFGETFARVECELYAGRGQQARELVLAQWSVLMSSLLFRKCQTFRIMLFYMRGRTALFQWLRQRGDRRLRRELDEYALRLAKTGAPWGKALGDTLSAGVFAGLGQTFKSLSLLERAETTFRQQDLRLLAAAVSRRRGELQGGIGFSHIQAADTFMRSENILRPDRMAAMILPGEWH